MYYPAELVLESYKPPFLVKGVYFITKLNPNTKKEYVELWQLTEIPQNTEEFLTQNGYPVQLKLVTEDDVVLATHSQIGWFDAGEQTDELYDVTLKELNTILYDYDGMCEVDVNDEEITPILYMDKVTISYLNYEEADEYVTDLDVWTEGKKLGSEPVMVNGHPYITHCVEYQDRLFAIVTNIDHELITPYQEAEFHPDDSEDRPDPDEWAEDDMDDDSWKED